MIKNVLYYFIWTVLCLLLGILYMRIILGTNQAPSNGWGYLLHLFYGFGLFFTGLITGAIIALIFILTDVFYLKKKLKNNRQSIVLRLAMLLLITVTVAITHYLLEKVIDIL